MTLQEHYNLIKEGKGNKKSFLAEAKRNHSDAVSNISTFDQAVTILKNRSVISENTYYADLQPITQFQPTNRQPFEKAFATFLEEQKKEQDEAVKIEEKKPAKHVEEVNDHNYDYADPKNVNNQIGQEVLNGIYLEVQKNPKITQEAAMKEVMKNLSKDKLYYVKEGQFGIEGLGYEEPVQEEVTGEYAASGYSAKLKKMVKESLSADAKMGTVITSGHKDSIASTSNAIIMQMMNEMEDKIEEMGMDYGMDDEMCPGCGVPYSECGCNGSDGESEEMDVTIVPLGEEDGASDEDIENIMNTKDISDEDEALDHIMSLDGDIEEDTMEEEAIVDEEPAVKIPKKNKKMTLQKRMSEIEKLGTALALEAKMEAIDEEIQERQDQLSMLDENDAMRALVDPKKKKEVQKEIKLLEKKRGQYEKMHAKASKNAEK